MRQIPLNALLDSAKYQVWLGNWACVPSKSLVCFCPGDPCSSSSFAIESMAHCSMSSVSFLAWGLLVMYITKRDPVGTLVQFLTIPRNTFFRSSMNTTTRPAIDGCTSTAIGLPGDNGLDTQVFSDRFLVFFLIWVLQHVWGLLVALCTLLCKVHHNPRNVVPSWRTV